MKTLVTLLLAAVIAMPTMAQKPDTTKVENNEFEELIQLSEDEVQQSDTKVKKDTMHVRVGKHHVEIVTGDKKARIDVEELEDFESKWDDYDVEVDADDFDFDDIETVHKKSKKKFDGHWSGFDFGANMFAVDNQLATVDYGTLYPEGSNFMNLSPEKSFEFNFNFAEYSFGFGSYVGIVTGLGFNFNNYRFADKITIKNDNGMIQPVDLPDEDFRKSKFATTYLHAPLMLEFQIPGNHGQDRLFIAGGIIGGIKLNDKTKYKIGDQKYKDKGNYNASPLRWGYTARIGFEDLGVFATYYNTNMFSDGTGPTAQPVTIGITANF